MTGRLHSVSKLFLNSAALGLIGTGAMKLVSLLSKGPVFEEIDPIFNISFRQLFLVTGIVEILAGWWCLRRSSEVPRLAVILSLATGFGIYRIGLRWFNWYMPCTCMGTLTEVLHLDPEKADAFMGLLAIYLGAGSFALLMAHRRERARRVGEI